MMNGRKSDIEPHILREIMNCIDEIAYGEVVVTIHDTRVVQVEKREKRRFDVAAGGKNALRGSGDRDTA